MGNQGQMLAAAVVQSPAYDSGPLTGSSGGGAGAAATTTTTSTTSTNTTVAERETIDPRSGYPHCVAGQKVVAKWPYYAAADDPDNPTDNPWFAATIHDKFERPVVCTHDLGCRRETVAGVKYVHGSLYLSSGDTSRYSDFASCSHFNWPSFYGSSPPNWDLIRVCNYSDSAYGHSAGVNNYDNIPPPGCDNSTICVLRWDVCGILPLVDNSNSRRLS